MTSWFKFQLNICDAYMARVTMMALAKVLAEGIPSVDNLQVLLQLCNLTVFPACASVLMSVNSGVSHKDSLHCQAAVQPNTLNSHQIFRIM